VFGVQFPLPYFTPNTKYETQNTRKIERAIMMGKKTLFSLLCLLCIILSACVPKEKFVELENQHSSTQAQLAAEQKQLADLQVRYERLQNANMSLLNTLEDLKFELRQEKTVVIEKEQAIAELGACRKGRDYLGIR
jgi:peptidoglycan hydrolase CwlO-like protein